MHAGELTGRLAGRLRTGLRYVAGTDQPDVGMSAKDVVWQRDKARLYHYRSDGVRWRPPVFIVYSLVGRSYVLDLRPGNSVVEQLLAAGLDVYLVDWGVPDEHDADNDFGTYLDYYLPQALGAVLRDAAAADVTVLGYCAGGVLAMLLAALHPELPIRNIVTLATPVDFTGMNFYSRLLAQPDLDPTAALDETGNVPGATLQRLMKAIRPTEDANTYVAMVRQVWNDVDLTGFRAMGRWAKDQVPLPGAFYLQAFELMRTNALVENTVRLDGRRVSLADITCPFLQVLAERDHITPAAAVSPAVDLVGSSDATSLRLDAGHVGMLASRTAAKETLPGIVDWITTHSVEHS